MSTPTLNKAITFFGGQKRLADALGIHKSNVSKWLTHGQVPYRHRIAIETLTEGSVRAADFESG